MSTRNPPKPAAGSMKKPGVFPYGPYASRHTSERLDPSQIEVKDYVAKP